MLKHYELDVPYDENSADIDGIILKHSIDMFERYNGLYRTIDLRQTGNEKHRLDSWSMLNAIGFTLKMKDGVRHAISWYGYSELFDDIKKLLADIELHQK